MGVRRYVARALDGKSEINTLNIKSTWELVEIEMTLAESEPEALLVADEKDDDDDWEIVEIDFQEAEEEGK